MKRLLLSCLGVLVCAGLSREPRAAEHGPTLQKLTIHEHFGVSHPRQIIDFDLARRVEAGTVHVLGPRGRPVVFQLLDGGRKLAVQTDLPKGASRSWTLVAGRRPAPPLDAVVVVEEADHYEITNGLTGLRVPKPSFRLPKDARPVQDLFNYGHGSSWPRVHLPAPVQGVRYRDGTWTATGPNVLVVLATKSVAMRVRFLERGPLNAVVEVLYEVETPSYDYGRTHLKDAGPGTYRATIELQAGQPSVLFEEETNLEMCYSLDLHKGLEPTHARYRGHHASRAEYGREPDGKAYRLWHTRRALDALVDLQYRRPQLSAYHASPRTWRPMAVWNPWAVDTGWYWQLFNAQAPADANLVGIFAGRPSRALRAAGSGTGIFTTPAPKGADAPRAGITVQSYRRSADNRLHPRTRYQWGLFVGVKGRDLSDPSQVQPIARQMNLHAGFNLNKIHRYAVDFPDPPQGYGALYTDREALEAMKRKLRADKGGKHAKGYHGYLYHAEPSSRPLVDMWKDDTGQKLNAAIEAVNATAAKLLDALVHGDGIYDFHYHYWHGGLAMMRHGVWTDQILADPRTSPEQRRRIKANAVLFANVLWDNDFVPLDNDHALNLGTANMPVQQTGYRQFYALLLARHPTMSDNAARVARSTRGLVARLINESGAEIGCPHYIGASLAPTLNTLLQLKQLGGEDPFKTEPRLGKFAEFFLNLLTPPEPRLDGKRGFIPLGDSSIEPSELYGTLATGFRHADPRLSARLMGAWLACGKPHSGFFGSTLLMIDERLPAADPGLGDANFPGYLSVLRSGWGTPNETAVWLVNGEHYSDHRHRDRGSVVIYALGAPLSNDWASIYTPQAPGAYMHSGVVLESTLGQAWDSDSPSLRAGGAWAGSTQDLFVSFRAGAYARAHFKRGKTTWTRAVTSIHVDESHPILVLRDSFAGEAADAPKVLTLNLAAAGQVDTPAGTITPPLRTHPPAEHRADNPEHQRPSATPPFPLKPGLSRFRFRGPHGVDWTLYTLSDGPQHALLGNWAVKIWGGHARGSVQRQHILRIRGRGPFTTLILPYRRGQEPAVRVTRRGADVVITAGDAVTVVGPSFYSFRGRDERVLAALDARPADLGRIRVAGGPTEVALRDDSALLAAHGAAGRRSLSLPGAWRATPPLRRQGDAWVWDYSGPKAARIALTP